jgi:hypothetical protein
VLRKNIPLHSTKRIEFLIFRKGGDLFGILC